MKNALTFDLEFWYDSEFIQNKNTKDFLIAGLEKTLNLLERCNTKATFFVTGNVAKKYPEEIKKISERGHEIASHGYSHKMIGKMSKSEFIKEISLSKKIIKKITGKNPGGFRAPSWSISKNEFWVYEELSKLGFKYSSSLFPVYTGLSGSWKFPTNQFKLGKSKITEVPLRPFEFAGIRIPFSGGIFFRLMPKRLISYFIKKMNKDGKRAIVYIHPWELCPELPKLKMSLLGKVVTYFGLKNNEQKLEFILDKFQFCPIEQILNE